MAPMKTTLFCLGLALVLLMPLRAEEKEKAGPDFPVVGNYYWLARGVGNNLGNSRTIRVVAVSETNPDWVLVVQSPTPATITSDGKYILSTPFPDGNSGAYWLNIHLYEEARAVVEPDKVKAAPAGK